MWWINYYQHDTEKDGKEEVMKNKLFIGAALGCSLLASSTAVYALSSETEALLKLLEEKKVITHIL